MQEIGDPEIAGPDFFAETDNGPGQKIGRRNPRSGKMPVAR